MKYIRKVLPQLAYYTGFLFLFQSCILYKSTPVAIEEASQFNDRYIKVRTNYGKTYLLRWFDVQEESIMSIKNTTKEHVDLKSIDHIKILDPEPKNVPLDVALSHRSIVYVYQKDDQDYGIIKHNFIKIDTLENQLLGLRMLGKDTLTITIPIKTILSVRIQDKAWSNEANVLLLASSLAVAFGLYFFTSDENPLK